MAQHRDDIVGKVALGATGVALAAGGVAAVAILTNSKRRNGFKKALRSGADKIQEYQHKIAVGEMGKQEKKVSTRGRKKGKTSA